MKVLRPSGQLSGYLVRGIDGDTVQVLTELGWDIWRMFRVRLMRIESWELHSSNREFALRAAARITEAYALTPVTMQPRQGGPDLHGRLRADVHTRDGDLADWLVSSGLAWYGKAGSIDPKTPQTPQP